MRQRALPLARRPRECARERPSPGWGRCSGIVAAALTGVGEEMMKHRAMMKAFGVAAAVTAGLALGVAPGSYSDSALNS